MHLPDLPMLHPPSCCPVESVPPPTLELNEHKQIWRPHDSLRFGLHTSLTAGQGSMSHLTTTLLRKQWASPGLQSKQLAYSDVQQWHSHRLCYDVRQHHNISCRRTDLDIIDFAHMDSCGMVSGIIRKWAGITVVNVSIDCNHLFKRHNAKMLYNFWQIIKQQLCCCCFFCKSAVG